MNVSEAEYNSLREELISRINVTNTLAVAAATFSVAAWTVGIALLVIPFSDYVNKFGSNDILNIFYLIPALFSFITILVLLPLSIKSSENILQSTAISCYIQVFYECKNKSSMGAWETINTSINVEKLNRGLYHNFGWLFNSEYVFLAVISLLLYLVSAIIFTKNSNDIVVDYILIAVGVLALILVVVIFFITGIIMRSNKNIKSYIKKYVQKGIDYEILSQDELNSLKNRFKHIFDGIKFTTDNSLKGKCVVAINNSLIESTSQIMFSIANRARDEGCTVFTASPKYKRENYKKTIKPTDTKYHIFIGNSFNGRLQQFLNKYTGYNGVFSHFTTMRFLRKLDKLKPDLIHIHNLHDSNLNLGMLFRYIRRKQIPVVWTLHDCWAFTGNCIYYGMAGCEKWKTKCEKCIQPEAYPYRKVDRSKQMFIKKKKWFSNQNLTLVTPSEWLKREVQSSFLETYPVKVINNGIDLDVFHYNCEAAQNLRNEYSLTGKFVVLGVASLWDRRKGLDIFNKLADDKKINKKIKLVALGITENDKKHLSKNIISVSPIRGDPSKIAAWYSVADIFLNPTRDDNFPTTNIESLACGTGVITFRTGGSPEMLTPECGIVIDSDDFESLENSINRCINQIFQKDVCRRQAEKYRNSEKFQEYLNLYTEIM